MGDYIVALVVAALAYGIGYAHGKMREREDWALIVPGIDTPDDFYWWAERRRRLSMTDFTGYDPADDESKAPIVRYTLNEVDKPIYAGHMAQLVTNRGRVLGLLRFESKEEMQWFSKVLDQVDRRRRDEEES